jgi:hypothetical protein
MIRRTSVSDITPVCPQVLSDQTVVDFAPLGSPQTQFYAPQSKAVEAANLAIANYQAAADHGVSPIPPAGVWVYADGDPATKASWHPAGELLPT